MQTERLTCDDVASRTRSLKRAADILKAGGIVAFPTETVYGLGVIAGNARAETQLRKVRGRAPDKPFTIAIAERKTVSRFVEFISPIGRRLMNRCWPGPLTIVFPSGNPSRIGTRGEKRGGETVGLRLPANELAVDLIRASGGAMLAPSANLAGEAPARNADEVLEIFFDAIDAVLDGGTVALGKPSTVVRLRPKGYEILRQGALSESQLKRAANTVVLLVCSGNSCRSPIAEALLRRMLAEKLNIDPETLEDHGYTLISGGTAGGFAAPASAKAIAVMNEMGVDLSNHLSQTITAELAENCDRIFVMTPDQMDHVLKLAPAATGRVETLDPKGRPIGDPHGKDLETYRRCAFVIQRALEKRIAQL